MRAAKQKGFTLIELLVVIAIIAVLTSIAVVALGSARRKARDAKRVADVKAIQNALELYYQESNGYPSEPDPIELGSDGITALCSVGFVDVCEAGENEFMGLVPLAPSPPDGDCTADQNRYIYQADIGGAYSIDFCIGEQFGDLTAGPHTATEDGLF